MSKTAIDVATINTNPFSRAFKGFGDLFRHNQMWGIILLVFGALTSWNWRLGSQTTDTTTTTTSTTTNVSDSSTLLWAFLFFVFVVAIIVIISTYVNGVLAYVAWKTSRAEKAGFGEAFGAVSKRFWSILGAEAITTLKVIGGLLLFVIPGIRAALRYHMVLLPIFDENLTAGQAIKRSKELTKNHLIEVLGIITVTVIPVISLVLDTGGKAVLYPELKAMHASKGPLPKVHWTNYLGILLMLLFIGLLVFITVAMANLD